MIHVRDIRKQFPMPGKVVSVTRDDGEKYCVGGAFIQYVEGGPQTYRTSRFPQEKRLARELVGLGISPKRAASFARSIITLNDDGNISGAWRKLDQVLKWQNT